mgnify:CR=1 FL=1
MVDSPATNTGVESGGLMCKHGALCFYSCSLQVDSFALRSPHERKAQYVIEDNSKA